MSKIVNLTPYLLRLRAADGTEVEIPSAGVVRVAESAYEAGAVRTGKAVIPLVRKTFGAIEGLPAREQGTLYVVSALAVNAAWAVGRYDVASPGDFIRDAEGRVIGAASLIIR